MTKTGSRRAKKKNEILEASTCSKAGYGLVNWIGHTWSPGSESVMVESVQTGHVMSWKRPRPRAGYRACARFRKRNKSQLPGSFT